MGYSVRKHSIVPLHLKTVQGLIWSMLEDGLGHCKDEHGSYPDKALVTCASSEAVTNA